MRSQQTCRLTVVVVRDAEPITGRLTGPGGGEHEFYGWTSLASAIERALQEADGEGSTRD